MAGQDFERGSGNVFADLGFPPNEAQDLAAKAVLILAVQRAMETHAMTQAQAAQLCGTDQPTLSKVLHGRMTSVTIDRLAHWLTALGQDVDITVRPAPSTRHGRVRAEA